MLWYQVEFVNQVWIGFLYVNVMKLQEEEKYEKEGKKASFKENFCTAKLLLHGRPWPYILIEFLKITKKKKKTLDYNLFTFTSPFLFIS